MRGIKDDLFQLIKSLSRNEKGYFKKYTLLYSAQPESANNYTRLFDVIDGMDEYDEIALKKQFTGEKFINQLPVTKNYLYNSILKSLRSYSAQSNDNLKILYSNYFTFYVNPNYSLNGNKLSQMQQSE